MYGAKKPMNDETKRNGGCLCGAVRYETTGEPFLVNHCHCRSCRRHNGAAVVTLAGFAEAQVRFDGDARKIYTSSPGVGRAFCGRCGTPLTWEGLDDDGNRIVELHISTFDEPDALVPSLHTFDAERIPWFDVADALPRYAGFADDKPPLRHGPVKSGLPPE